MSLTLTSLLLFSAGFLLLKFATGLIYKLLGLLVLVALIAYLMFHFGVGPFKQNPISIYTLEETYCQDETNVNKCECIVQPIKADLANRFTVDELEIMDEHREKMSYAVGKSFQKAKSQIATCLNKRGAINELKEFQQDLIPIENQLLEKMSDLKNDITEKSKQALDSLISDKKSVDHRYQD